MDAIIYNIPVSLVPKYAGRRIVVRAADPSDLARQFAETDLGNVEYFQLLSADIAPESIETLSDLGRGIPVDIVIGDPAAEFPLLYNFSKLIDKHPVRASITVATGFSKAVRLALALRFAVKLDVGQPGPELIDELHEVLDLYLHGSKVSQPVEYFHSMFLSAYREEPASLWIVQEDDPDHFRYVTDDGLERMSFRFGDTNATNAVGSTAELECDSCEFFGKCGGYFKWPESSYDCAGVRSIFRTIETEAAELRRNVAGLAAAEGGSKS